MAKEKPFMEISNVDIYNMLKRVNSRTIKIEKHAIATNGKVDAHDKSIGLLWKFVVLIMGTLIGGGYAILG